MLSIVYGSSIVEPGVIGGDDGVTVATAGGETTIAAVMPIIKIPMPNSVRMAFGRATA